MNSHTHTQTLTYTTTHKTQAQIMHTNRCTHTRNKSIQKANLSPQQKVQSTHIHASPEVLYKFWVSEGLEGVPNADHDHSASIGWGWSVMAYLNAVTTELWMYTAGLVRSSCGGRKKQALQQAACVCVHGQWLQRSAPHCNIFVQIFVEENLCCLRYSLPLH